jgi:hypothetical protein
VSLWLLDAYQTVLQAQVRTSQRPHTDPPHPTQHAKLGKIRRWLYTLLSIVLRDQDRYFCSPG